MIFYSKSFLLGNVGICTLYGFLVKLAKFLFVQLTRFTVGPILSYY